jgi:hypothetical protein
MEVQLLPHQDRLIYSKAAFPALGGGWGNGKTKGGCIGVGMRCDEFPDSLWYIGRKHFTDLRDSTLADFMEQFSARVRFSKTEMSATFGSGSKVLFRHLENAQLSNLNLSGFWIDQAEEVPESVFLELNGRTRRPFKARRGHYPELAPVHQGMLTFNMRGHNWIYNRFVKHVDADGNALPNPEDYDLITAPTLANKANLPAAYVLRLLNLPESVRNRFVFGSWDEFEGRIYPMFQEHTHVIAPFTPPEGWEVFEMADHGYNNPTAWLWGAVDYDGNVFIFDEHYERGKLVADHAKAVRAIRQKHDFKTISYSVIDPSTRNREGITGLSVMAEYADNGIDLTPGNNEVLAGINRVAEYLTVDPERRHPLTKQFGSPRLFVTRNCVHLIEELREYQWQVLNNRTTEKNQPEHPRKFNDHAPDALRYGLMLRPDTPVKQAKVKPGTVAALKEEVLQIVRAEREAEQEMPDDLADYA